MSLLLTINILEVTDVGVKVILYGCVTSFATSFSNINFRIV